MDDEYKSNFKEAILSAQKSLYSGTVVALFIWGLATTNVLEKIKVPVIGFELDGKFGLLVVMLVFMALGAHLLYSLKIASDNISKIQNEDLKQAILLSPSILNGPKLLRLVAVAIPFLILVVAMSSAINLLVAIFTASVYSIFHFYALFYSYKINA
ncbi:MAG: hypothetical protein ACMZ64_02050 [Oleiphilus sp.]